jgi:NAD-dependent deacetylase
VVNSGDPMPLREMMLAKPHARRCDPMLGLGSSLLVTPAAALVGLALGFGARVVLVNRGETPYDEAASPRVETGIGEAVPPALVRAMQITGR